MKGHSRDIPLSIMISVNGYSYFNQPQARVPD